MGFRQNMWTTYENEEKFNSRENSIGLTSTAMSVDGLFPHPVARAGDGEDAAEDGFRGQVRVVDETVNDNVEASATLLVIGLRQGGLAVV